MDFFPHRNRRDRHNRFGSSAIYSRSRKPHRSIEVLFLGSLKANRHINLVTQGGHWLAHTEVRAFDHESRGIACALNALGKLGRAAPFKENVTGLVSP